jgi:hypothetical protein
VRQRWNNQANIHCRAIVTAHAGWAAPHTDAPARSGPRRRSAVNEIGPAARQRADAERAGVALDERAIESAPSLARKRQTVMFLAIMAARRRPGRRRSDQATAPEAVRQLRADGVRGDGDRRQSVHRRAWRVVAST